MSASFTKELDEGICENSLNSILVSKFLNKSAPITSSAPTLLSKFPKADCRMMTNESSNTSCDQESNFSYSNRNSFQKESLSTVRSQLQFIKKTLHLRTSSYLSLQIKMPRISECKKTLVLDLDETLIHTSTPELGRAESKSKRKGCVLVRPFAQELLRFASTMFEVIVFTASRKEYANKILNHLDPDGSLIALRVFREHCISSEKGFVKDLRIFRGRSLEKMIIVDNSIISFAYQIENGVPISSWFGDKTDRELLKLIEFLRILDKVPDVRLWLRSTFALNSLE